MIRSSRIPGNESHDDWTQKIQMIMSSEEQPVLSDNSVFSGTFTTYWFWFCSKIFKTIFKGKLKNLKNFKLSSPFKKKMKKKMRTIEFKTL